MSTQVNITETLTDMMSPEVMHVADEALFGCWTERCVRANGAQRDPLTNGYLEYEGFSN